MNRSASARVRFALFLPAVVLSLSALVPFARAEQVPPPVAGLLPDGSRLASGSWGVFETEFGKTFTGEMRATIPGRPISCDSTVGPELRLSLKGDTAWEEPPMLEMAVEQYESSIAQARKSLPERVARLRSTNSSIQSIAAVREERLPNGVLLYAEQVEECARHTGGNTVLLGFARRGATVFEIDLFVTAGPADAVALAKDALARFAKLDVPKLVE